MSNRMFLTLNVAALVTAWASPVAIQAQELPTTHRVRIVVTVGQVAPYADQIYLAGTINDWQPGKLAIPHVGDGIYARTVEWPIDGRIEYKFTRGATWATVEKGFFGEEIRNRTFTPRVTPRDVVVFQHVARWADQREPVPTQAMFSTVPSRQTPPSSSRTGDVREIGPLDAPQLGGERSVLIYLPPGYDESKDRYPVLYMLDGQNVFDASTSFIGVEWGLDEAAEGGIKSGTLKPCIIVAVYNSTNRFDEYTPYVDEEHGGGEADKFMAFLIETLKPYIDKEYRTQPDRQHTALAGSSLGGLLSLYAATKYHATFQTFGVVAPSLQWADYRILRDLEAATLPNDLRFWIEVGVGDTPLGSLKKKLLGGKAKLSPYHSACRETAEILRAKGITGEDQLHYQEFTGWFHDEHEWSARATAMLDFLMP